MGTVKSEKKKKVSSSKGVKGCGQGGVGTHKSETRVRGREGAKTNETCCPRWKGAILGEKKKKK